MHPLELTILWLQLSFASSVVGFTALVVSLSLPKGHRWGSRAAFAWLIAQTVTLGCLICAIHAAYLPGGYADILKALGEAGLI